MRPWLLLAVACVVPSFSAVGCLTGEACKPKIDPGAVFKVTLVQETATSDHCHLVDIPHLGPFQVTAADSKPTPDDPTCSLTPAVGPPEQTNLKIDSCEAAKTEMLGVYCQIEYKSTCPGFMTFFFKAMPGVTIDWNARSIDNVLFRVEDFAKICLPDLANCIDEYQVHLDRIN